MEGDMTLTTLVRRSLRTLLLGSAAFCVTAAVNLPPAFFPGGSGAAFAQGASSSGHGGAGGYRGGAGSKGGASGMHGSGEHESSAGEEEHGSTHGSTGGEGGHDAAGGTGGPSGGASGGAAASRGHHGESGGEASGEGSSEESKGPHYGGGASARKPEGGSTGGRPNWASEGIPETELGRLNVARAPASVLDHAFSEVTANWPTTRNTVITLNDGQQLTVAQLYSKPAVEFARIVQNNYQAIVRIDSPLENLSLLKDVVTNHRTVLSGVTPASSTDLAAIFLGSASDKTIPITTDTVTALYTILGMQVPQDAATLATEADAVRSGISIGHGE
ncbi:MAG TPA: hypothetical protein VFN42_08030 [Acetobacteraceae bacterium]|nr:hypothetical protein [Acetobacteraceae bacterium]